jgi:hypothetical protein
MKLRYDKYYNTYHINSYNIAYYRYWSGILPCGHHKERLFGLYFWKGEQITNNTSGIKIIYR